VTRRLTRAVERTATANSAPPPLTAISVRLLVKDFLRCFLSRFHEVVARHDLSPRCSACSVLAAEIEVTEVCPGEWRLRYRGPGGSNGSGDPISAERATSICEAFTPRTKVARLRGRSSTMTRDSVNRAESSIALRTGAFRPPAGVGARKVTSRALIHIGHQSNSGA
jgi:hypothetical protein